MRLKVGSRMAERKAGRSQKSLFPETELLEPLDAKTQEVRAIFAARRSQNYLITTPLILYRPSQMGMSSSSRHCLDLADRMIFRAEMGASPIVGTGAGGPYPSRC